MHIHFMVNGIGLGHAHRSLPIMRELARRNEVSASGFGPALNEIRDSVGCKCDELPPIGDIIKGGDEIDVKMSIWENIKKLRPMAIKRISDVLSGVRPDAVVVDGYVLGVYAAKMHGARVANIANCTKLWYVFPKTHSIIESGSDVFSRMVVDLSDKVIVPDLPPPFTVSRDNIAYFGARHKFHYVGPTALIKGGRKKDSVLVSRGGSGVHNSGFDDVPDMLERQGFETVYTDGKMERREVERLIASSRFAVLHGGHTSMMSCISASTPVIGIPLGDYTERVNNSKGIEAQGLGAGLDESWLSEQALEIATGTVLSRRVRENVGIFANAAHKGQGHIKAARIIESLGE